VDVAPKVSTGVDPSQLLWNAVQVELLSVEPAEPTEAILRNIHEVAPAPSLALNISIVCPMFTLPQLPPEYAGKLFRLIVEISRPSFASQQVVLSQGSAQGQIKMQRTLEDIIKPDALSIVSFSYRVKNVYFTQEGQWSQAKQSEGVSLFVFPNASEV
jgi:hypothetical protein